MLTIKSIEHCIFLSVIVLRCGIKYISLDCNSFTRGVMIMRNSDGGMIFRKINLYILSLSLLFFFFIVITIDIPFCFSNECKFIGFEKLIFDNVTAIICVLLFLYSIFAYWKFKYDIKQSTEIPFEVVKVEGINYEHLTFLATYVIPLITFDFEKTKYIIVLAMLLVVMGVIYIKTDLFYANPSLALMGFHIYKLDGVFKGGVKREGIIVITRKKIKMGDSVKYIKLDDRVYYSGY